MSIEQHLQNLKGKYDILEHELLSGLINNRNLELWDEMKKLKEEINFLEAYLYSN